MKNLPLEIAGYTLLAIGVFLWLCTLSYDKTERELFRKYVIRGNPT